MTNTSKTILFFGTEDFSLTALAGLIEAGYKIGAVVTKPDTRRGRGQRLTPPAVKSLAARHGIPVWQPEKPADIINEVKTFAEPAGVLVSYGKIIPPELIGLFRPGIINVHPSLLPRYRGPSPIEAAILNGDRVTGVSIMQLTARMDAGPVYAQARLPLDGTETKPLLHDRLAELGTKLLLQHLPAILNGRLQPQPQDESEATYCRLLKKTDGQLDPKTMTAADAERRVRAFLGFPKTRLTAGGQDIIVTKAHVAAQPKTPLDQRFRDGAYLVIDELVAPNGRAMPAEAYLRGRR